MTPFDMHELAESQGWYASAWWSAADLLEHRPNWSADEREDWLAANAKYIRDAMVIAGWEAIDALLPVEKKAGREKEDEK